MENNDNEFSISLQQVAKDMELESIYDGGGIEDRMISSRDINRCGQQLMGYLDYFDSERIQIIGLVECTYLESLAPKDRLDSIEAVLSRKIPALIITRDLKVFPEILESARKNNVPVFSTYHATSSFMAALIAYLNKNLAPRITRHGVLVEIYGEGVLILGESGVGKSETALELIHRGHMLVADDAVELKVIKDTIQGSSPDKIQDFIELRGVGFINVRNMYGVAGILRKTNVDLVIELVEYEKSHDYERSDAPMRTFNVLGVEIPKLIVPVIMGRNLAIIVEVAAKNFRLKQMGYDANEELIERMNRD